MKIVQKNGVYLLFFASLLLLSSQCNSTKVSDNGSSNAHENDATSISASYSADIDASIEWITLEEMQAAQSVAPKKVMIDVYTSWCGWCKKMDKTTFANAKVASYLNEYYYAVKLDAESKETILFDGQEYDFIPNGSRGHHALAASLLDGQLSYPTIVFLDEELGKISGMPGYQTAGALEPVLVYLGEEYYESIPYQEFEARFSPSM